MASIRLLMQLAHDCHGDDGDTDNKADGGPTKNSSAISHQPVHHPTPPRNPPPLSSFRAGFFTSSMEPKSIALTGGSMSYSSVAMLSSDCASDHANDEDAEEEEDLFFSTTSSSSSTWDVYESILSLANDVSLLEATSTLNSNSVLLSSVVPVLDISSLDGDDDAPSPNINVCFFTERSTTGTLRGHPFVIEGSSCCSSYASLPYRHSGKQVGAMETVTIHNVPTFTGDVESPVVLRPAPQPCVRHITMEASFQLMASPPVLWIE